VALVTPMRTDGAIDYPTFERLIDWHIASGTNGIVAVGTTGESATLNPDEHIAVISHTVRQVAGRIPVLAGTGSNSTSEAIELSLEAKKVGADVTLQVVPYYNKPTQHGLLAHFSTIADAVDLPHILYNVPGRTVTDLLPATTIQLARHPRIVGLKDATAVISRVAELRHGCGEDFALLSGEDISLFDFMHAGGDGVISVTANLFPRKMAEFCRLMLAGETDRAKGLHLELIPAHKAMFVEPNPIPVKWALEQVGRIGGGIRLPLTPLSDGLHQQVRDVLPLEARKS